MNDTERDTYGMYTGMHNPHLSARVGPGPELMGAETFVGTDVHSPQDEHLGNMNPCSAPTWPGMSVRLKQPRGTFHHET